MLPPLASVWVCPPLNGQPWIVDVAMDFASVEEAMADDFFDEDNTKSTSRWSLDFPQRPHWSDIVKAVPELKISYHTSLHVERV